MYKIERNGTIIYCPVGVGEIVFIGDGFRDETKIKIGPVDFKSMFTLNLIGRLTA